jgi:hypothetical protein
LEENRSQLRIWECGALLQILRVGLTLLSGRAFDIGVRVAANPKITEANTKINTKINGSGQECPLHTCYNPPKPAR